jgi:trimethylamine:corrinoid methyltransferase-like protein
MIYSERALNILNDAGADVDEKTKVARIPAHLVMESVRKCKRPVRLCARNPKNDLVLDGKHLLDAQDEGTVSQSRIQPRD